MKDAKRNIRKTNKEQLKRIGETFTYNKPCDKCEVKYVCSKDIQDKLV